MDDPGTTTVAGRWRRAGEVLVVCLGLGLTIFGGPIAHLGYFRPAWRRSLRAPPNLNFEPVAAILGFLRIKD